VRREGVLEAEGLLTVPDAKSVSEGVPVSTPVVGDPVPAVRDAVGALAVAVTLGDGVAVPAPVVRDVLSVRDTLIVPVCEWEKRDKVAVGTMLCEAEPTRVRDWELLTANVIDRDAVQETVARVCDIVCDAAE
jgi:hypothetical protein